jgi:hypothetical protein
LKPVFPFIVFALFLALYFALLVPVSREARPLTQSGTKVSHEHTPTRPR